MNLLGGFFACIFSALVNLALVVLLGLEHWNASGFVLDQLRVYVGPNTQYVATPTADQLHQLDLLFFGLAIWANARSGDAHLLFKGVAGWILRWIVDFVPSVAVFIVSGITLAIALIALMRDYAWPQPLAALPILMFFVESIWDLRINQSHNTHRLFAGEDRKPEREEPVVRQAEKAESGPRRGVVVTIDDRSIGQIAEKVGDVFDEKIAEALKVK